MLRGRSVSVLCRTCLGSGKLLDIFTPQADHSLLIAAHTGVQVSKDDGLPQQMCFACLQLAKSAAFFCRIAVSSDEKLRGLLCNGEDLLDIETDVKNENENGTDRLYDRLKSESDNFSEDDPMTETFDSDSTSSDSYKIDSPPHSDRDEIPTKLALKKVERRRIVRRQTESKRPRLEDAMKSLKRPRLKDVPKIINRGDKEWRTKVRELFKISGPAQARIYECRQCGVRLKQMSSMHVHAQKHLGYRVICETCGKGFPNNCALQQHNMNQHGQKKTFGCTRCPFSTAVKYELNVHERTHTGERPFVCDTCGSSFYRRRCLIIHTRSHADTKPHKCTNCEKRFVSRAEMLAHHNAVHQRRYVFSCPVCGHTYARRTTVYKHIAAQHNVMYDKKAVTKILL